MSLLDSSFQYGPSGSSFPPFFLGWEVNMIHFPCNLLLLLSFCNYFEVRISPVFKSMKSIIFLSVLNIILIVGILLWSGNAKEIYLAHRIHHIHMYQNLHFGLLKTSTNIRDYARHDCSWRNLSTIPDFLLDAYYISSMIFWATMPVVS